MQTANQFDWMNEALEALKSQNLYRSLRVLEGVQSTRAILNGKPVTLFCGNDYLGFSTHPRLIAAAQKVIADFGVAAGSARLISGTTLWHSMLENRIAKFMAKEKALVFSSGYLANLGVLTALVAEDDLVLLDKLSHASLIDAAQLSKGALRIFPHQNLEYLEKILSASKAKRKWIVTDSIFSMDGDLAQLKELVEIKNRYGAYLIVDEAHGTGVYGKTGRGVSEHFGVLDEIDVHIGTLSKAIGSFGGFVVGKSDLIEYLIHYARPFMFETALPASLCAAAFEAFELVESEPKWRDKLWQNVRKLRSKLAEIKAPVLAGDGPIIPVIFGDEKETLDFAQRLVEAGFLVPAIRYPTVPKGKARLRLTVSALHSESEIDALISAIKHLL